GDGTKTSRKFPTKISGITNIVDIAAGYDHTFALKKDGTLWAWGSNSSCELGDGTKTSRKFPTKISGITNIVDIAAGSSHTLALKKDGTVWAWGNNFYGQLGNGTRIGSVTPVKIDISEVSKIFTSNSSSYAVKSDGTVWAWGDNYHGQLGDGTTTNRKIPTKVSGAISGIIDIAASDYHSVAIKSDGTIYTWGKGVYLGAGENANDKTKPTSIGKISGAINVTAGDKHTILLKNDNTLYAWGDGGDYKLGTGSEDNVYSPVVIPSPIKSYNEIETLSVATDVVESKTSKRALCYAYAASNVGSKKHWIKVIEFDYIGAKFIKNLNTTEAGYEYSDVMIARSSAQDGGHMAQVGWCKSGWNLAYGRGTGSSTLGSPTVYDANPACIFRDKSCSHGPWGLNDCKYYADSHGDKNCVESDTSGDDSVILMCCKAYNE
ncbi:MAG: hypothetical protein N4A36_03845, partial [Candidatus Gracilibacteria bacterium]|nr:hypothetical protein [Candidatus Gracilibacteria bacterium]